MGIQTGNSNKRGLSSSTVVLSGGDFAHQGTDGNVWMCYWHLVDRGQMVPNILSIGQPPTINNYPAQMSIVPSLRNST